MTTQKKLLVAALTLALPFAALAQPTVTGRVFGLLNLNLQNTRQSGVANRFAISTDSSNVGWLGDAEIQPWLKLLARCETTANINGISLSGICNRNSRVGVSTDWGTVFYGNWDTPFKAVAYGTKADDPFLDTDVFGYQSIMGSPGFNYRSGTFVTGPGTTVGGFDVRAGNSVAYWSPNIVGLSLKGQWSVNEFKNTSGTLSPWLFSVALNYDKGPLSLLVVYELHNDSFALNTVNGSTTRQFGATAANPTSIPSADWAWRAGAGYELTSFLGSTRVGVLVDQLTLGQDGAPAGAVKEYQRLAWQVAFTQRIGNHEFRARYSMADSGDCQLVGVGTCSTNGYGAQDLTLGYAYYLAKNAHVFLSFVKIFNDTRAQYTFGVGGETSTVAGVTTPGSDPSALGLGLRYAF